MFDFFTQRKRARLLAENKLPDALWQTTLQNLPFLARWSPQTLDKLRDESTLFLIEKNIYSGHDALIITPEMRTLIAAQACTLIVHRSQADYAGWRDIIVHPDQFPRTEDFIDEAGVVHQDDEPIAGEAWEGGPVLLSWPDVWESTDFEATGMNLVVHEFAHKIDMRNGEADGVPPLPNKDAYERWQRALNDAYADFCARVDAREETWIDPYASEDKSEFFAVCAEIYVAAPEALRAEYAAFYAQMNAFFQLWGE